MFITCSAVVGLWRAYYGNPSKESHAQPAQVCPSHRTGITMTEINQRLLDKYQDIVEELTTNELDQAFEIIRSRAAMLDNQKIQRLHVGQRVMFRTRNRGDKYGTIEKVMRKRVKVRVTSEVSEDRKESGFYTPLATGQLWTVNAGWVIPLDQ